MNVSLSLCVIKEELFVVLMGGIRLEQYLKIDLFANIDKTLSKFSL